VQPEILQRDDLSLYVVAGVPKYFKKTLCDLVKANAKGDGAVKLVDSEMTDWILTKLREKARRRYQQTPASAALWRAFRALSAARYHLSDPETRAEVQELRDQVERLWTAASPLHPSPETEETSP
jgi:hypothetical protein